MVTPYCVTAIITLVHIVIALCNKFPRRKTDCYENAEPLSANARFKTRGKFAPVTRKCPKIVSHSSSSASSISWPTYSHDQATASLITSPESGTKDSSIECWRSTTLLDNTQPTSSISSSSSTRRRMVIHEELGDIKLVKPRRNNFEDIEEILKKNPQFYKKAIDEHDKEMTNSTDDTLAGVESLLTDNLTSGVFNSPVDGTSKRRHVKVIDVTEH